MSSSATLALTYL